MNFLPEYKALHDAGYNVLAYDMRNHGMSGQGNGGVAGIGLTALRRHATRHQNHEEGAAVGVPRCRLNGNRLVEAA
ncbi:Uncharacterised protein [Mycobacteroides abscessus subsp. abscessus]|nr:Uncharacterised protein [Mycobacteroides abscessus subsp. abscessus]